MHVVTAPEPAPWLGAVELVPGQVTAALLHRSGELERTARASFGARAGVAEIEDALYRVGAECFGGHRLLGIGVAAAGLVDAEAGVLLEVHDVPALHGYPVVAKLSDRFGAPAAVEHRARLQVLGDRWFGAGRGRATFASVSTGTVLGAGVLYEGRVLAPQGGRSGAHMTVAASGLECTCGKRGCWKTLATTSWLTTAASARGFRGDPVELLRAPGEFQSTVDEYADNIALGLVNIQQLFAPGLFIVHGEAVAGGEPFRARIEARLCAGLVATAERPSVVFGEYEHSALLGGAGLVLAGH
ncbi:ROK family protein [Sciscionella marina]|uniref:ROK family protein n=1 Tax=Sciscionella marina TaxID=508770 RepID=UPI00037B7A2E|nr:ROK family protein [Sciscionella marina]